MLTLCQAEPMPGVASTVENKADLSPGLMELLG